MREPFAKTERSYGAVTIAGALPGQGFEDLEEYLPETREGSFMKIPLVLLLEQRSYGFLIRPLGRAIAV